MDKEEVKKLIKADFEKLDQTRLNLYWKRPASGVHVKPVNRDAPTIKMKSCSGLFFGLSPQKLRSCWLPVFIIETCFTLCGDCVCSIGALHVTIHSWLVILICLFCLRLA